MKNILLSSLAVVCLFHADAQVSHNQKLANLNTFAKVYGYVSDCPAVANVNVNSFTLPGGYTIRFTGMRVKQQDGSQLQAIGIQPDVFVKETIKGVTEGRDEFMEKAMELLR